MIMGLTHNFGIEWYTHPRWGKMVKINYPKFYKVKSGALRIWRQSLGVDGALLFNCLPYDVRNYPGETLSGFKMKLDQLFENIPDCPISQGLYPTPINVISGRNSNCIIDWCRHLKLNSRGMDECYCYDTNTVYYL